MPDRLEEATTKTLETLEALAEVRAEYDALKETAPALVGAQEAAELLKIHRVTFATRRRQGRIPPPIADLASGPVWLRAQFTWPNTLEGEQ